MCSARVPTLVFLGTCLLSILACAGSSDPQTRLCDPGQSTEAWVASGAPVTPEAAENWVDEALPLGERVWICPTPGERRKAYLHHVSYRRLLGTDRSTGPTFERGEMTYDPDFTRTTVKLTDPDAPDDYVALTLGWTGFGKAVTDP